MGSEFSVLCAANMNNVHYRSASRTGSRIGDLAVEQYTSYYFLKSTIVNPIPPLHKLFEGINDSLNTAELSPELKRQFRQLLQSALARMDLVTREEFDAQAKVLQHTRERLEALEREVAELAHRTDSSE